MSESLYIGAYWDSREESIERCAQSMLNFLTQLRQIDPIFHHWYKPRRSRKDPARHELELKPAYLSKLLLAGRYWNDLKPKQLMPQLGFCVSAWNGGLDSRGADFRVHCGGYGKYVSNSCVIHLPKEGPEAERVLRADVLKNILEIVANNFEPDRAVVTSHQCREKIKAEFGEAIPYISWVTYFSSKYGPLPAFPASIKTYPIANRGSIVVLTPDRFSPDSEEHMSIARKAQKLLAPLCPKPE